MATRKTVSLKRRKRAKSPDRAVAIRRAHRKAFPRGTKPSAADLAFAALDATILEAAQNVIGLAERAFEAVGEVGGSPASILREGLRSAAADLDIIGDAAACGSGVHTMVYVRAQARCELALAIADFRERYGWPVDADGMRIRPKRVDEQGSEVQS